MPKFLDYHAKLPPMPPEAMQQVVSAVGKKGEDGVTLLNGFFGTASQGWCYHDAPDADAVCRHHEAMGIPLGKGDVHEVQTLA